MSFALITGASKGIGKAIAEELAKHNYSVLLVARSESLLRQLAQDISTSYGVTADYLALNLSDHDAAQQVKNWCDQKGYTVTVLVNNAGYGLSGEFDANSLDANNEMIQGNFRSALRFKILAYFLYYYDCILLLIIGIFFDSVVCKESSSNVQSNVGTVLSQINFSQKLTQTISELYGPHLQQHRRDRGPHALGQTQQSHRRRGGDRLAEV